MNAQTQTAPGMSRRGSNDTAMGIAREGYHGTTPPKAARAARHPLTVSRELHAAAECLAGMAEGFAAGAYDTRALSSADALLVGCGRLICELRQRREVTP